MILAIEDNRCPNCDMPLSDEMACDYCDWVKNLDQEDDTYETY